MDEMRRATERGRAIRDELATIRLGAGRPIGGVLPAINEMLGAESMLVFGPVRRADGWALDTFDHDGFARPAEVEPITRRFLASAPERFTSYDPQSPARAERNRVLEATGRLEPDAYAETPLYRHALAPFGVHRHKQLRVLVCEGSSLLAWVGAFLPEKPRRWQYAALASIVPALRERLSVERRLRGGDHHAAAVDVLLERLGAAAFVLERHGHVAATNTAGRAMLERRPRDVTRALRDAAARRPTDIALEVVPLVHRGAKAGFLAIARSDDPLAKTAERARAAAARWRLTPRQLEVLALVARGLTNAVIAAELGLVERTVELHVTALLDRAGVASRAALVAALLAIE